jgi:hypothetical protein
MLDAAVGLTRVATGDLEKALSALHHGDLRFPLTIGELTRVGLQDCADDLLGTLRAVDEHGARAVLVAVLAERLAQRKRERREQAAGAAGTLTR